MEQPAGLISVLMDPAARLDERDDAAMDLRDYDDVEAEEALLRVAGDPGEAETIQASAGESLAAMWLHRGQTSFPRLDRLTSIAKKEAIGLIQAHDASWLPGRDA